MAPPADYFRTSGPQAKTFLGVAGFFRSRHRIFHFFFILQFSLFTLFIFFSFSFIFFFDITILTSLIYYFLSLFVFFFDITILTSNLIHCSFSLSLIFFFFFILRSLLLTLFIILSPFLSCLSFDITILSCYLIIIFSSFL